MQTDFLKQSLGALRRGFLWVLGFSFVINLLMLVTPLYMLQVYDRVLTSRSNDTLLLLTLIVVVALMVYAALDAVRTSLMVRLGCWLDQRLSGRLLSASVASALQHEQPASVQSLRDLATYRAFMTGPSIFPIMDAPWTPIYLALIFMLHPVLGWVGVVGALLLFFVAVLNEVATRGLLQQANGQSIRALDYAGAAVRNADVIVAMGMMPNMTARWNQSNSEVLALQARASSRSGSLTSVSKFLRLLMQIIMLGGGAWFVIAGEMSAGGIIASSILVGRALSPVDQAIASWRSAIAARNAQQRIREQLETFGERGGGMALPAPSGKVDVENLTIGFPTLGKPLLRGVSFSLQAGEAMGLIGHSGSGKTSLARALLGNLKPLSGHARLDGMDVSEWVPDGRGQYMGYLPQDVELFAGSIRENIARMGEGDPEDVVAAAQLAGVHELIMRMPKGYDTIIGDAGMTLSGGERQRVALARALYGNPKFVVLDEPNASLDRDGEAALLECLRKLKERAVTVIIIAHRPKILEIVDKVAILQDGVLHAFGPRDEVLKSVMPTPVQIHPKKSTFTGSKQHVSDSN